MARDIAIGIQDFSKIREKNCFYVDKTAFIREWWESNDDVTLIARPRRFGKTLNMSMLECFFSVEYANRGDLFEGLSVWESDTYRMLQGTYPVISLSFANVKETDFNTTSYRIRQLLMKVYEKHGFLRECDVLSSAEKAYFERMASDMSEEDAPLALYQLSDFLYRYYGKKVIILLDEYDTPMEEAYVYGYWEKLAVFTRSLFNSTFKTNPYLERAVMTGITRISKESIFSDLNNLKVVTTTSDEYAVAFGFTEEEVFASLEEYGYHDRKEEIKNWYDGFIFGKHRDIYNPWSILNFLDTGEIAPYWANTSSNRLISKLLQEGNGDIKKQFECLLRGQHIRSVIDEQIVFDRLNGSEKAIWSLLLSSGYLKVVSRESYQDVPVGKQPRYELAITNQEINLMFRGMVSDWFSDAESDYNGFVKALLAGNLKEMNAYMNQMALKTFSCFDVGKNPSKQEPERFYHGFVLGLLVELAGRYMVTSNGESGFGRYDVMIEPKDVTKDDAFILEFKVRDMSEEGTLEDTVRAAHAQIEEKQYETALLARGIASEHIRKYGFAFEGKQVLIG